MSLINIPTAEEMATSHVRECYYNLVRNIAENIEYAASHGHNCMSETIPIDYLEAIVRTFTLKGYEVEHLGEGYSERGAKEEIKISWEGEYEVK